MSVPYIIGVIVIVLLVIWLITALQLRNLQVGPDDSTHILADVVQRVTYKHWTFTLEEISRGQGSQGLTLVIRAQVPDSTNLDGPAVTFAHLMPVLPAAYNRTAWEDWVFEQILMVEHHESLEWYRLDGEQVYFPSHAPGDNPYTHMRIRSKDEAYARAEPWYGGPPTDPHCR